MPRSLARPGLLGAAAALALALSAAAGTQTYCVGAPNSAGPGASISWRGPVTAEHGMVVVDGVPAGAHGWLVYGFGQEQTPFGDGFGCIPGANWILARTTAAPTGVVAVDVAGQGEAEDLAWLLHEQNVGVTWSFQLLYRDPAAGGAGFNASNALTASFPAP